MAVISAVSNQATQLQDPGIERGTELLWLCFRFCQFSCLLFSTLGGFLAIPASKTALISYLFHLNCTWLEHIQQLILSAWAVSQLKIDDRAGCFGVWHQTGEHAARPASLQLFTPLSSLNLSAFIRLVLNIFSSLLFHSWNGRKDVGLAPCLQEDVSAQP